MPILDLLIYTLAEANLLNLYVGYTPPTTNQRATAWLLPQNPSWGGPGVVMLWDQTQNSGNGAYVAATPPLFTALLDYQGNLVTEGNGLPPTLGVPGSVYFRLDTGQIYYMDNNGVWQFFQTAIANIGTYITGHGGPGDPLDVNLAALEAKLIADLANKIQVAVQSPITGNGTTGSPLGLNYVAAGQGILSTGVLNFNVSGLADNNTIVGAGITGNPYQVNVNALTGRVKVAVDGITVTGDGTTPNPLVAHAASALVTVTSPITGNGSPGSPVGLNYTACASGLIANGGLNFNVQVRADGTTIQGDGTGANPLHAVATGPVGGPGGLVWASGQFSTQNATPQVQRGCSIVMNFPGQVASTAVVTFNSPTPDTNYVVIPAFYGPWVFSFTPPGGAGGSAGYVFEGISNQTTSGFTLSFAANGPSGPATLDFIVVR